MYSSLLLPLLTLTTLSTSTPLLHARQQSPNNNNNSTNLPVTSARYDTKCYYPSPTDDFSLSSYLGTWYQIAGTPAPFLSNCKCISATYGLNRNGTVSVANSCLPLSGGTRAITINGTATALDEDLGYGEEGVLRVIFPGQEEPECPGPNYVVQAYDDDEEDGWAVVQSAGWGEFFLLSRERQPSERRIQVSFFLVPLFHSHPHAHSRFFLFLPLFVSLLLSTRQLSCGKIY